jgi:NAD(P)-dependent dehydrogenase (short-subunit alcohol dehydrogenase family)
MNKKHNVIVITGATGGLGSMMAKKFALKNFNVVINYLKSEKIAHQLCEELNTLCGNDTAVTFKADVTNRIEVKIMFDSVQEKFKNVDVLINAAGINLDRPFLEMSDPEWSQVISTILTGTFICSQEFAIRYKGDSGHIINIGSLTAIRGRKNGANYCSARAGVVNLTKCMAQELAPNIRVNCVTPGWINTDEVIERYQLHDPDKYEQTLATITMRRLGTPEDITSLIQYLVFKSSFITGQNYLVDGGMLMY